MTVYVDDWRQVAKLGRYPGKWSHLIAGPDDPIEELHAFAQSIGLRREWFQDKPWPRAHYDVPEFRRRQAIAAGAVPITWRELGQMLSAARQQRGDRSFIIPDEDMVIADDPSPSGGLETWDF